MEKSAAVDKTLLSSDRLKVFSDHISKLLYSESILLIKMAHRSVGGQLNSQLIQDYLLTALKHIPIIAPPFYRGRPQSA